MQALCPPSSGLDVTPAEPVERQANMPVSVLLHRLSDDTAPDYFTLKWLMSSMHQQSFGMILLLMAEGVRSPNQTMASEPFMH
jgi:hypothetical protein